MLSRLCIYSGLQRSSRARICTNLAANVVKYIDWEILSQLSMSVEGCAWKYACQDGVLKSNCPEHETKCPQQPSHHNAIILCAFF
jgi:hypothetical protein